MERCNDGAIHAYDPIIGRVENINRDLGTTLRHHEVSQKRELLCRRQRPSDRQAGTSEQGRKRPSLYIASVRRQAFQQYRRIRADAVDAQPYVIRFKQVGGQAESNHAWYIQASVWRKGNVLIWPMTASSFLVDPTNRFTSL
jgi:hypothetical protein